MKKIILALALAGMAFLPSLALAETKIISEAQVMQAAMQLSPDFQAAVRDGAFEKAEAGQEVRLSCTISNRSLTRAALTSPAHKHQPFVL